MKKISQKQLLEDSDFMINTFEEVHPNLNAMVSKNRIEKNSKLKQYLTYCLIGIKIKMQQRIKSSF